MSKNVGISKYLQVELFKKYILGTPTKYSKRTLIKYLPTVTCDIYLKAYLGNNKPVPVVM